jgi:hypothetical protein
MPNLENLKKQAKLILRRHRDRYHPVAAQIRSVLPRYRDMTDSEILAQEFKLGDAQELVARQHGFENWQALKQGLPAMSDHADTTQAKAYINAAEPQLFVADIGTSCGFFTSKLGFSVAFTYGEPAYYAQVTRDGARLIFAASIVLLSMPRCEIKSNCCRRRSPSRRQKKSNSSFLNSRPPARRSSRR